MVDKELLSLKLQELERYLAQLKKHQGVTADLIEKDLDQAWIIQHGRFAKFAGSRIFNIGYG